MWEYKEHRVLATIIGIWVKYIMTGKMGAITKIEMSGSRAIFLVVMDREFVS